jgi:hypothetical protein
LETIHIDLDNNEVIAKRVVALLMGKAFTVVSAYENLPEKHDPAKMLEGHTLFELAGPGYALAKGRVEIKLLPYRRIFWDAQNEKVAITFYDKGGFILERILPFLVKRDPPGVRIIYRAVTTYSNSPTI